MTTTKTFFDNQNNICSDMCWMDYKNHGNEKIVNYNTYEPYSQLLPCENSKIRTPDFMYDHPNLRGRAGYGLSEPCHIDTYSSFLKNDELMTKDKCRIQLTSRIFTGVPQFWNNLGSLQNKGFEIELSTKNIQKKNFTSMKNYTLNYLNI